MKMERPKKSAWDAVKGNINRGYGHLPVELLDDWACHQSALSEDFSDNPRHGASSTPLEYGRKQRMLERLKNALETRSHLSDDAISYRLTEAELHLEDPGLLENFEYFNVPSSDYMIGFYFAVWDRRIAEAMDYLHNHGKDLKGVFRTVPQYDIWYQMSYFEGMNIDKRKSAQDLVDFIKNRHITKATSFGGGHIPERFYGLPSNLKLTVFDNGPVGSLTELFPDAKQRQRINYIHEPLSDAPKHQELLSTQSLVWMHGVSMYLDESQFQMTGAVLRGTALLKSGGYMRFDLLVWNESMRRVIRTQCWPNDPNHPMTIFNGPEDAISYGRQIIANVNSQLGGRAFVDVVDIGINLVEPWGVTGVIFTIQKHA